MHGILLGWLEGEKRCFYGNPNALLPLTTSTKQHLKEAASAIVSAVAGFREWHLQRLGILVTKAHGSYWGWKPLWWANY